MYQVEKLLDKRWRSRVGAKTRWVHESFVKKEYSSKNTWERRKNIFDKRLIEDLENGEWDVSGYWTSEYDGGGLGGVGWLSACDANVGAGRTI